MPFVLTHDGHYSLIMSIKILTQTLIYIAFGWMFIMSYNGLGVWMSKQPLYFILVRSKLIQLTPLYILYAINLCPCSLVGQHGGSGLDSRHTHTTIIYNVEKRIMSYHTVNKDKSLQKGNLVLQHPLNSTAIFSSNQHWNSTFIHTQLHP